MQPSAEAPLLTRRQERTAWVCLVLCLCFLVADRWLVLHQFGFRYVDDDQAIMWNGAMEMAHGRFHEPCFYGQRYSIMLEGLVAVPLLWFGVGPEVALPLMTSVLTLFPFVLLAVVLARKRAYVLAAVMLAFPVTLPPEFGMISSMPRGFVSGVFLSSLAVFPLFSRRSVFLVLSPFFAILALFANPNAALVLLPTGILILLKYHSDSRLYLYGMAGALPASFLYYLGHHFYDVRPNYVVHTAWELSFNAADIRWADLRYLDELSPLFWGKGLFVFVLLGVLVAVLTRTGQWRSAVALSIGIVLLVISFGVNKVHDGIPSVFYPWARMFLAIPFLFVLFVAQLKVRSPRWAVWLMPLLAAGFFGFKCLDQAGAVAREVAPHKQTNVEVAEVAELKRHCIWIDQVARANHARLVVIAWGAKKYMTNYGCPCLIADFPSTIQPALDRRTWWLHALSAQVMPNVLFAGFGENDFKGPSASESRMEKVAHDPLVYLLKDNTLSTQELLDELRVGMRPN